MNNDSANEGSRQPTEGELADAEFFAREDELYASTVAAQDSGTLRSGSFEEICGQPAPVQLALEDAALARQQAAARGLAFEPYVAQLVHEALLKQQQADTHAAVAQHVAA